MREYEQYHKKRCDLTVSMNQTSTTQQPNLHKNCYENPRNLLEYIYISYGKSSLKYLVKNHQDQVFNYV